MKTLCVLMIAVVADAAISLAQTNAWPKGWPAFSIPHVQLRPLEAPPKQVVPTGSSDAGSQPQLSTSSVRTESAPTQPNAGPEPVALDVGLRGFELEVFRRLDRAGCFERAQRASDSAVLRWAEGTFRPEVLRVGGTEVTCSLVTAVKRKNPLCLLDPILINVAW